MKPIVVTVKSIQRDASGQDVTVEMVAAGRYYEKKGTSYIMYNETEATGMEETQTTIKVSKSSIVLLRTGKVRMRNEYVLGRTTETLLETPVGALQLAIKTHALSSEIVDGVGTVHLGYDISINGEWQFYNQLLIDIQEDREYGNEGDLA